MPNTLQRYRWMTNILFVLSGTALTFLLTLNYSVLIQYDGYIGADYSVQPHFALLAAVIMLPVYIYIALKKDLLGRVVRNASRLTLTICVSLSLMLVLQLILDSQKNYWHIVTVFANHLPEHVHILLDNLKIYKLALLVLSLGSSVAMFTFFTYAYELLKDFAKDFIAEVDVFEKYYFVIVTILCFGLICYIFARTDVPWNSLDAVYQSDPIFVTEHYFPVFSFGYDFDWDIGNGGIRHPLTTLLVFPIHFVCWVISVFFYFVPNILPTLYAFVLAEMLIVSAIALKRITKTVWTALLFTVSFPFVFFTVFVEKYQLSALLLILFSYTTLRRKNNETQKYFLIAGSGMMVTSAYMGFFYSNSRKFWEKLKDYISAGLTFFATLIATGRIHYILAFAYLNKQNSVMFFEGNFPTISERIISFFNFIASCFIPVAAEATETTYYWTNLLTEMNWFGVAICAFLVFTLVRNWKSRKVRLFAHWIGLAILEWIFWGINCGAGPLFSLYFSWAVLSLFVLGVNSLIKKHACRAIVYVPLLVIMFYTNVAHMTDLLAFMVRISPLG